MPGVPDSGVPPERGMMRGSLVPSRYGMLTAAFGVLMLQPLFRSCVFLPCASHLQHLVQPRMDGRNKGANAGHKTVTVVCLAQ